MLDDMMHVILDDIFPVKANIPEKDELEEKINF